MGQENLGPEFVDQQPASRHVYPVGDDVERRQVMAEILELAEWMGANPRDLGVPVINKDYE